VTDLQRLYQGEAEINESRSGAGSEVRGLTWYSLIQKGRRTAKSTRAMTEPKVNLQGAGTCACVCVCVCVRVGVCVCCVCVCVCVFVCVNACV
jgi:hypothetical protein